MRESTGKTPHPVVNHWNGHEMEAKWNSIKIYQNAIEAGIFSGALDAQCPAIFSLLVPTHPFCDTFCILCWVTLTQVYPSSLWRFNMAMGVPSNRSEAEIQWGLHLWKKSMYVPSANQIYPTGKSPNVNPGLINPGLMNWGGYRFH